jgi:hypothetical protein
MMREVHFSDLSSAVLTVDAMYKGGHSGGRGDDPITKLLSVGNAGGFRLKGSVVKKSVKYGALYSNKDSDWPDVLDIATGTFIYHGDQKVPGKDLHDTPKKGNLFLREIFEAIQHGAEGRKRVPPLFLFEKGEQGADAIFRGLLAPGGTQLRQEDQLIAAWRSKGNFRYLNYRATFTILDVQQISREWVEDLIAGNVLSENCPSIWRQWVRLGIYHPLTAERPVEWRTKDEQLPGSESDKEIIQTIYEHFSARPTDFEPCAAELWTMMASNADITEVTRPSVDHGRDAIGTYSLGPAEDPIKLSFSLEAKCYASENGVGVRELARLISRLRHREFGVLVTTSYVSKQVYEELRDDRHPVVVLCAADIVRLLRARGFTCSSEVAAWLGAEYPAPPSGRIVHGN